MTRSESKQWGQSHPEGQLVSPHSGSQSLMEAYFLKSDHNDLACLPSMTYH